MGVIECHAQNETAVRNGNGMHATSHISMFDSRKVYTYERRWVENRHDACTVVQCYAWATSLKISYGIMQVSSPVKLKSLHRPTWNFTQLIITLAISPTIPTQDKSRPQAATGHVCEIYGFGTFLLNVFLRHIYKSNHLTDLHSKWLKQRVMVQKTPFRGSSRLKKIIWTSSSPKPPIFGSFWESNQI